ncbi:MAG: DUF2207 domain-containing protein [Candidatus Omnitrophica bacterium]|jgi:uncharacterized membrane protein YgcG|nr:DUF2207 domain-containing protein [Candidatus Omnitrophota bacterium]
MKLKIFPVSFLVLICFAGGLCHAQSKEGERIVSFVSEIAVHDDSTMTVTENIEVISEGNQIKRGIYRDFPTKYQDKYGHNFVVDFKVLEVQRNGAGEDYHIDNLNNGKRLYIGNKARYLSPGKYLYTIRYKTDRQLGFFDKFDELYWNVTGNGWSFPIDNVVATVSLPQDAGRRIIESSGYTGRMGSKERAVSVSKDNLGRVIFTATRPFLSGEGLTIVVAWPKGYVKEPSFEERAGYVLRDNSGGIAVLISLLILVGYYLFVWARVGKDPAKGTIIPLYEPPKGFSAAALRCIMKMDCDNKAFTSAIIEMAVKGGITISEEGGKYTLERTDTDDKVLSSQELSLSRILFSSGGSVELKNTNHTIVKKAMKYLQGSLLKSYEAIYFLTNKKYFVIGALLSLILMFMSAILQNVQSNQPEKIFIILFMCVWLSIWTVGVIALLYSVISAWRSIIQGLGKFAEAIFLTLFSIPFVGGEILGLGVLFYATSFFVFTAILATIFINILFYRLLRAPTFQGRKIMDKIEGFKMYLSVAEKNRLNVLNPPEVTPQIFEKYLPYALALDVEQEWAQKFSKSLAKAGEHGQSYNPSWYRGPAWSGLSAVSFAGSLGSGFSNAISSSSTPPGSSGGSGGGGSSGGGGGGGGGGGW